MYNITFIAEYMFAACFYQSTRKIRRRRNSVQVWTAIDICVHRWRLHFDGDRWISITIHLHHRSTGSDNFILLLEDRHLGSVWSALATLQYCDPNAQLKCVHARECLKSSKALASLNAAVQPIESVQHKPMTNYVWWAILMSRGFSIHPIQIGCGQPGRAACRQISEDVRARLSNFPLAYADGYEIALCGKMPGSRQWTHSKSTEGAIKRSRRHNNKKRSHTCWL